MIRLIDTTSTVPYSTPLDTAESKTVFHIAPLSSHEMQTVNDATTQTVIIGDRGKMTLNQSLRNRLAFQLGVRSIDNLGTPYAKETRTLLGIPDREVISEALLNKIPINIINDVGEQIQKISVPSLSGEDAEKN